jgi:hypothetical protein
MRIKITEIVEEQGFSALTGILWDDVEEVSRREPQEEYDLFAPMAETLVDQEADAWVEALKQLCFSGKMPDDQPLGRINESTKLEPGFEDLLANGCVKSFSTENTVLQTILKDIHNRGVEEVLDEINKLRVDEEPEPEPAPKVSLSDVVIPSYCVEFFENLTSIESQSFDFGDGDTIEYNAEEKSIDINVADETKRKNVTCIADVVLGVLNQLGRLEEHLDFKPITSAAIKEGAKQFAKLFGEEMFEKVVENSAAARRRPIFEEVTGYDNHWRRDEESRQRRERFDRG